MELKSWIWVGLAIFILLIILLVVWLFKMNKKNKLPIDYYTWFSIGIVWVIVGIFFHNAGLSTMGLVFMILSLIHKKDWKRNNSMHVKCSMNSPKTKLMLILAAVIILGILLFILIRRL